MVENLLDYLAVYVNRFGADDTVATAAAVLEEYVAFNRRVGFLEIPHERRIVRFLCDASAGSSYVKAGVTEMHRASVLDAVDPVGIEFFQSRSTVRNFSEEAVSSEDVTFAAIAAQKAPAVCNRQAAKIHVFQDRQSIDRLLRIQSGARGFETSIGSLAVITADLRNYWEVEERHQAWVDGGLVAMSFVLGLHARGLGSVCLNWSKSPSKDEELIELLDLPPASAIIMMVGFGHLREKFNVATSARSNLAEFLIFE
ncbi:nitroreductase family protein [Rhodococcus opacus]|uniref:nitroreductase family protein n=1 Tax=Rhodococcus opacus TaxID=37919 RepID=UPI001C46DDDA|nr:nitroreductase family protein [Rhodococcus opacus]MBV6760641.1 nitroreductase family protein [Rhodococcus opacus]